MRLVVLLAEDLRVSPIELLVAAAWALIAAPFIFGLIIGILVGGATS